MTEISKFDKATCRELRRSMQEAMDRMDIDGLTIKVGNMTFTDNKVTIKVTAETDGAEDDRSQALQNAVMLHGVKELKVDGHELIDFHPKKRKFPFIMRGPQGGRYKLSPDQARSRFGKTDGYTGNIRTYNLPT